MSGDKQGSALDFCLSHAHILQTIPYHQCGIALRNEETKDLEQVEVRKFTSLGEEKWQAEHKGQSHEEYMISRNRGTSVPLEEDCFYKMQESFKAGKLSSALGVLHSRYSSTQKIKDILAHPHFDEKNRIAIFHNGFIANYEDLAKQLKQSNSITIETDS